MWTTQAVQKECLMLSMRFRRNEAEAGRVELRGQLDDTNQALQQQAELRQRSEVEALRLAVESQQLAMALEIERLIKSVGSYSGGGLKP